MKTFASSVIAVWLLISMAAPLNAADALPEVHCVPVAQRSSEKLGCWITGREVLGELPQTPLYWHVYEYPSRVDADSAKGKRGSVVESYGKIWLFSIADAKWTATGGKKVARIGPLPIAHGGSFTATYMEATFVPGMSSHVHRHAGPEAWYVLAGEQCLETPGGKQIVRAGESGIVPEGPPMMLSGIGKAERRSLVLILHDSAQPSTIPVTDWTPTGSCQKGS